MIRSPAPSTLAIFAKICLILAIVCAIGFLATGCATSRTVKSKPSLDSAPTPVAAIAVSMCGKSLALFVVMDDNHMTRFSGAFTALYDAVGPSQLPTERHVDAVPWDTALALAQRAPLTSHVVVPCQDTSI